MKKLKENFRRIMAIAAIFILGSLVALVARGYITPGNESPASTASIVSPAEVADEIIEKEKAKEAAAASTHANVVIPPSQEAMKPPEPKFSDAIIYIGESIALEQANFLKEVSLLTQHGELWQVWMQSRVSFLMRAYANDTEVDDSIGLSVYLQPEEKWDNDNYVILDFTLAPPSPGSSEWGATIKRFESKTQGRAQFSEAHNIFREDWQKAEILHLARQVLNIALTPRP